MILGLQIIAILFALSLVYFAILGRRRGEIDRAEFMSWVIIWTGVIFVVIFPNLLRDFATNFFITRLFDLMVVGGFILVISMVFASYVKVKRIEKKLEKFIRDEALKLVSKKDVKKKK